MQLLSALSLGAATALITTATAQTLPANLVGTWTTKSNQTLTGPGFFNYTADSLIEPSRTGFSYSFTADGHYEEAYYRAISNPANPQCPSGIMQWQHGTWEVAANGSLVLSPLMVDGRQLLSEPCTYKNSIYTRYNQTEVFQSYTVALDTYNNRMRLELYEEGGAPLNPMWLIYSTPLMCPTTTLNPMTTASATATGKAKVKRGADFEVPMNFKMGSTHKTLSVNPDWVWWAGMAFTGVGGLLYFGPRRMGIQL